MPADTTATSDPQDTAPGSRAEADADAITDATQIAAAERASGWRTIRKVAPYLWPADKAWVKRRVVISLLMLAVAKLIAVGTPFLYKAAVDMLAGENAVDPVWLLGMGAVGVTVAYGMARALTVGFNQLRDAIFARVAQRALRQLARELAA
jgi:ATP-binding cassette subfamily B protein